MLNEKYLTIGSTVAIEKPELDALLADLRADGFQTVGPRVQDEAIVYKEIEGLKDLPRGIKSEQKPGAYRLVQNGKNRYFDFIPAMHSWKMFLFPSRVKLFEAYKEGKWELKTDDQPEPRYALIGVRACELSAIQVQDRTFLRPDFQDPIYRARREGLFILAVNCLYPNATCFCASMGTGPRHQAGFDLCLTEMDDVFLVEVGSELGLSYLDHRKYELPSAFVQTAANQAIDRATHSMGRTMDTSDLPELLTEHLDAERWAEVAKRCLDLGLFISLAGPVTYKNARALPEVARFVPADRLVLETDCPFLPPHPHRGQRNEPAWVAITSVSRPRSPDAASAFMSPSSTALNGCCVFHCGNFGAIARTRSIANANWK